MRCRFRPLLALPCLLTALSISLAHADDPVPVAVVAPAVSATTSALRLSGSLSAERHANLSPRVDGLVAEILVDAGSRVAEGDILLQLDPAIATLTLAEARAASAETRAARDETRRLLDEALLLRERNHIGESEVATRRAGLALAEAALNAAQAREETAAENLRRHQLTAPFAGVIAARMTDEGEWIARGDAVLELVALDPLRLDVRAPQERFADIDGQTAVTVIPDSRPDRRLTGRITARVPVSDPQARAFLVRVVIDDPEAALLPGTSATALFELADDRHRLLVPRDALLRHPDGAHSLFVVADGRAQRRSVAIGREGPEGVEVTSGLAPGEQVVIRGNEVLREGQAVHVVDGPER